MTTEVMMEALKHRDVRGKELLYLKIEKNGTQVLMNIGEKSYNALIALGTIEEVREEIDSENKQYAENLEACFKEYNEEMDKSEKELSIKATKQIKEVKNGK